MADSNPAIRSYIIKAWEQRTGAKGVDAFLQAMSKRQVSFNDVMAGYELAAKDASSRVKELANTLNGEEARLANMNFAQELDRTKGPLTESARTFTKAQQEMAVAMAPIKDVFYEVAAAGLSLAAKWVTASASMVTEMNKNPAMQGQLSNEQRSTAPMASSMGRGLLSVPDMRDMKAPQTFPLYPLGMLPINPEAKQWQQQASQYMRPSDAFKSPQVTSTVTVLPGAITLNATGMSEERLIGELEGKVRTIFQHETESLFRAVSAENPELE